MYDPTYQHAKTINAIIDMFKANRHLPEKIAEGSKITQSKKNNTKNYHPQDIKKTIKVNQ